MTPELPRVVYAWPDAEPDPETRKALDHLSARVVRLGHSSSFVAMRVADGAPACNWQPAEDGPFRLRVTRAGQLTALEDRFDLHRETLPRVMPADFQPYVDGEEEVEPPFPAPFLGGDWLILRRTGGPDLVSPSTVGLACSIRRALLKHASQPVSEMISGHRRDGSPSDVPHLAIVPLPFVGHRQADGRILGVALAVPRDASIADRTALFQAVANWEAAVRRDDEDAPELPVFLGRSGVLQLRRQEDDPGLTTLRSRSWCRPARRWLSATPVALDRHPGDLRSRNIAKLSRAVQEAQETIAKACERIGLPAPRRITVLPAAPLAGAYKTRAFPHYPPGRDRERRALTHVTLEFAEPVRGPLLIGAGRYLGLGLLTPEVDRDD